MSPITLIFGFLSALATSSLPAAAPQAAPAEQPASTRITSEPGACCFMLAPCQFLTDTECEQLGGMFMGEGTSCDVWGTCLTWGACCTPDGGCHLDTDESCGNVGIWFFINMNCNPDLCSLGACCREDGMCVQEIQVECGGTWIVNTACSPNPCLPPDVGACCLADEQCDLLTAPECEGQQGHFMGTGIACNPYPCSPVPVERATWGRIKVRYR
jgi:hypothetical protein